MPDTGIEDPVSVSPDGKTVTRFGREKIDDIPQPTLLNAFFAGSDVYILAGGIILLDYSNKWRTPSGETMSQPASKRSTFVAHFAKDGRYLGAVTLDLTFDPQQIGVFENGDFLIAGIQSMSEARVAIVAPNGQLRRFIDLNGDVRLHDDPAKPARDAGPAAPPPTAQHEPGPSQTESFFDTVSGSRIVRDGRDLLLFRPTNAPIFSISPSGEVRPHKLRVDGDYRVFMIKPTQNAWVVEFTRYLRDVTVPEFSMYAFNPGSGAPMREYFFPSDLGWGFACVNGNEFTFVTADHMTNTITLVKLAPLR